MSKLYLVRHGHYDHKDGCLTIAGVKQAITIGSTIGGFKTDVQYMIYTSPILRAKVTADLIGQHVNKLNVIVTDLLREIETGESWEELKRRAMVAFRMAAVHVACDAIVVTHRAVIQAIMSEILVKDPNQIIILKGQVYQLSTSGTILAQYEDRWGG